MHHSSVEAQALQEQVVLRGVGLYAVLRKLGCCTDADTVEARRSRLAFESFGPELHLQSKQKKNIQSAGN